MHKIKFCSYERTRDHYIRSGSKFFFFSFISVLFSPVNIALCPLVCSSRLWLLLSESCVAAVCVCLYTWLCLCICLGLFVRMSACLYAVSVGVRRSYSLYTTSLHSTILQLLLLLFTLWSLQLTMLLTSIHITNLTLDCNAMQWWCHLCDKKWQWLYVWRWLWL